MKSIQELEAMGFKRWTKGNMDRMYINATDLGLACEYYKTGNISYAEFQGHEISHSRAYSLKASKTYIDLTTNTLVSNDQWLMEAAAALLGIEYISGSSKIKIA